MNCHFEYFKSSSCRDFKASFSSFHIFNVFCACLFALPLRLNSFAAQRDIISFVCGLSACSVIRLLHFFSMSDFFYIYIHIFCILPKSITHNLVRTRAHSHTHTHTCRDAAILTLWSPVWIWALLHAGLFSISSGRGGRNGCGPSELSPSGQRAVCGSSVVLRCFGARFLLQLFQQSAVQLLLCFVRAPAKRQLSKNAKESPAMMM